MKKLIYPILFLLMVNIVFAIGVERSISGNQVTLTITGSADKFGGIISETLPSGYSPTGSSISALGIGGSASGKLEGQLYEIAFISDVNPAIITYGIAGTGSGTISGSYAFDEGQTGIILGQSQLGQSTQNCIYDSICDETDSCGTSRDTDGTICETNKVCNNGACIASTSPITCWKKTNSTMCSSYQVTANNCGQDFAAKEVCEATKDCNAFIKNLPTYINMPADCDAGVVMLGMLIVGGIILLFILKSLFK